MDGLIEQVRLRAYELWQMNGMRGCDVAHWTAAEMEIQARATHAAPAAKKVTKAAPKSAARKPAARKVASKKDAGIAASI